MLCLVLVLVSGDTDYRLGSTEQAFHLRTETDFSLRNLFKFRNKTRHNVQIFNNYIVKYCLYTPENQTSSEALAGVSEGKFVELPEVQLEGSRKLCHQFLCIVASDYVHSNQ
jgi:hypothetical protein